MTFLGNSTLRISRLQTWNLITLKTQSTLKICAPTRSTLDLSSVTAFWRFRTNVVGMSIEKLFDMWRNYKILKYYVICAAVSALSWLSQFCTSRNRFRENSKIRNFVTYQITFLLTCQPHKFRPQLAYAFSRIQESREYLYSSGHFKVPKCKTQKICHPSTRKYDFIGFWKKLTVEVCTLI